MAISSACWPVIDFQMFKTFLKPWDAAIAKCLLPCYGKRSSQSFDMSDQLDALYEAATSDSSLKQKLDAAADANAVVAIAKEAGFEVSVDELNSLMSNLTEEQLSSVSGGMDTAGKVGLGVGGGITAIGWGGAIALAVK